MSIHSLSPPVAGGLHAMTATLSSLFAEYHPTNQQPARPDIPAHCHYHVRCLLQVTGNAQITQHHESTDIRWFAMYHK